MTPKLPDLVFYQMLFEFWQRIEPRSRSDNITRSLPAQVRDPAWMLTRQWQVGEFAAEDAGSPIKTSLMTTTTRITRLKYAGMKTPYQDINHKVPLEAYVERDSIFHENNPPNWRFRIQAGQQFARELKKIPYQIFELDNYPTLIIKTEDRVCSLGIANSDDSCLLMDKYENFEISDKFTFIEILRIIKIAFINIKDATFRRG